MVHSFLEHGDIVSTTGSKMMGTTQKTSRCSSYPSPSPRRPRKMASHATTLWPEVRATWLVVSSQIFISEGNMKRNRKKHLDLVVIFRYHPQSFGCCIPQSADTRSKHRPSIAPDVSGTPTQAEPQGSAEVPRNSSEPSHSRYQHCRWST